MLVAIGNQLTGLCWTNTLRYVCAHQVPDDLYITRFGINCGNSAVNGIAKPQRLGRGIVGGAERLQIVMNPLRVPASPGRDDKLRRLYPVYGFAM